MNKNLFYYDLPKELIAQEPLKERSSSRLLVLDRKNGAVAHRTFKDIGEYINKGDCLVLNDTKVMAARLMGEKTTGAVIELLLLKRIEGSIWEALIKPGKRIKEGDVISFGSRLRARALEGLSDGVRRVELLYEGIFEEVLDELGEMPLPPYITKKLAEKERYQTVYARNTGSAAAPTAGLHFTEEVLEALEKKGVAVAKVTLHVGLGTFRPIKAENILDHEMHSERYIISPESADIINNTKKKGGRIIAVGTTSVRTLESAADEKGLLQYGEGDTSIFIYPGYKFKITEGIITNFHLPESTLMALVSAFAGRESILAAYREAVDREYRFFSFGDCMAIF